MTTPFQLGNTLTSVNSINVNVIDQIFCEQNSGAVVDSQKIQ